MLSPAAGHTFFRSNSQCQHLLNVSAFSAKILGVPWAPGTRSQVLFHYGRQHLFFLWLILLIFVCVSYHITFEEIMRFLLLWRKRGWNLKLAPKLFQVGRPGVLWSPFCVSFLSKYIMVGQNYSLNQYLLHSLEQWVSLGTDFAGLAMHVAQLAESLNIIDEVPGSSPDTP